MADADEEQPGIKAYHGSPHEFDQFDISKIGTGEGAQSYGHGLYFAENEGVARGYRDALSQRMPDGYSNAHFNAQQQVAKFGNDPEWAAEVIDGQLRAIGPNGDNYKKLADTLDMVKSGRYKEPLQNPGRMYEVNINAHPDHFLDWDKPLAGQSKRVIDAVSSALRKRPGANDVVWRHPGSGDEINLSALEAAERAVTEKTIQKGGYGHIKPRWEHELDAAGPATLAGKNGILGTPQEMSAALKEAGIPGIKYLDQGSRGAGDGTHNYVVFDHNLVKVKRRYEHGGEVNEGYRGGGMAYAAGGSVADDPSTQRALNISAEAQKPKDKWGQNRSLEFNDLASILEGVRSTNLGQMVGRYQHAPAEHATRTMYEDLKKLATEGKVGRKWYEKSSKRILDYLGGDKTQADKFAQLFAIYSPQTTVPVNTSNAMKAYNRASLGHKIWNGDIVDRDKTFNTIKESSDYVKSLGGENAGFTKVPLDDSGKRFLIARHNPGSYENIATADRDLKAHLVMNEGVPFEGRKTNNFYNNLMVHIDKKRLQGSTQDLWMAKAFGFHDPAVGSGAKYDYMERLTEKLSNELGWKPHQVQAAIWTAMKTRQESVADEAKKDAVEKGIATLVPGKKPGQTKFAINDGRENDFSELLRDKALGTKVSAKHIKESARDFSDFLDQNLAHVSWESAPSKQIDHLNGIEDLSPEAKAEHHGLTSAALHDKNGNDLLAKYLGMMSPGSLHAHGYWEGKVNPASHLMVGATRIKAAEQSPQIDEPSRELMDIYADAKGLLHKQDGVGYHRPFYNPKITEANGIEYEFGHDLNAEHIKSLGKAIDQNAPGAALIPAGPRKVKVINFSGPENEISHPNGSTYFQDADAPIEAGHTLLKQHKFSRNYKDQRDFHKAVDRSVQGAILPGEVATQRVFASDGNLRGNNWQVNRNGEDYLQRLRASRRPDVLEYVATVLAPRVAEVDRAFAEKHGLKTDPGLESSIQNAHRQQQPEQVAPQVTPPVPAAGKMTLRNGGGVNAPAAILPSAVDDALRLTAQYQPPLPGRQQSKPGRR